MKIYLVLFQYCTDDCDGVETQAFSTYEKAVERFNELIKDEKSQTYVGRLTPLKTENYIVTMN